MNDKQLVENLQDLLSDIGGDVYHIEQVHGFLTAVIIGPKMIMPDEWLPFLFDAKGRIPDFKSDAEMSVFPMIMEFYNHIIATLDSGEFAPVIMGYRQRKKINIHPAPWCNAFIEGTGFCRDEWFGEDNEELMGLITPILHFADQKEIHGIKEPVKGENLPKADEILLDAIPDSVLGIREYWRKKQFGSVGFAGGEMGSVKTGSGAMPDNLVPFEKRPPKVGRNEPCSCGSGKKYKKCCGADQ